MIKQAYDADADALYVKLADRKVAHTVEVDNGTLADLDSHGDLVGIEVIRPARAWPLEQILERFPVSDDLAKQLRAEFGKTSRGGGSAAGWFGVIAVVGAAAVWVAREIYKAISRVPAGK